MKVSQKLRLTNLSTVLYLIFSALLAGCGGGDGNTSGAGVNVACPSNDVPNGNTCAQTYFTVGVTVSGLTSGTLVLQNNGAETLIFTSNSSSQFATGLASGLRYAVSVLTQPSGHNCTVTNGSGEIARTDVTGVVVSCRLEYAWTWMSGSNAVNASGVYGTQGVASASNVPGARSGAISWIDNSGNLWLMGGLGYGASGNAVSLNDLWKYDTTSNQWTWVSGSKTANASGVYGTQGTASASNLPGARTQAVSWIDSAGNFWIMGGNANSGSSEFFNDLWKYNPASNQWTWVSGSDTINASGLYGAQGEASASSVPGARFGATSWTDSVGNLWLMGGFGYDGSGSSSGNLNDLWSYNPASKQWTWVSGSNTVNASGVYGAKGAANASSVPGARFGATSWTDSVGNLWLMGGLGYDGSGSIGNLNDLWSYNPASKQWTWLSGSSTVNASGVYGAKGSASASSVPRARFGAAGLIDSAGNAWLFGGFGYRSSMFASERLNDIWKYNPTSNQWNWVSGSNMFSAYGVYGTQGTASASNVPGARNQAVSWIDNAGNLWFMGGSGYTSAGSLGNLNDLWRFVP